MRILVQNLRGINTKAKRRSALRNARGHPGISSRYDLILYQEVRLRNAKLNTIRSEWGQRGATDRVFLSGTVGDALRGGVLTLISNKLDIQHLDSKTVEGHAIINLFRKHGKTYLIGNIYGNPNANDVESRKVITDIAQKIEEIQDNFDPDYMILAGDWNCVLRDQDTTTQTRKPQTENALQDLLNTYNLVDIFHHKSPRPTLTWTSDGDPTRKARHDRIYVTPNLLHNSSAQARMSTTDHMSLHSQLLKTKKGIPEWKFDDCLLTDETYTQKLDQALRDIIIPHTRNENISVRDTPTKDLQTHLDYDQQKPQFILQAIISKITDMSKTYMSQKRKLITENNKKLHETFIEAKENFHRNPTSEQARQEMNEATVDLHRERAKRATEAALRMKVKMTEEGDKPTSYFLSLAKKSITGRDINMLTTQDDDGDIQTLEGEQIVDHMTKRYKKIIAEPNPPQTDVDDFLGNIREKIKKVPEEYISILESPFSEQELKTVVSNMKNQSAPGPLGISNMLLKKIFPSISKLAVEMGNSVLRNDLADEVPEWITNRNIIFVLKPDKPVEDADSYRGISLLNNLYKIYAAALATRMSLAMPHIIHQAQKGYIRGKSAAENVRGIADTLKYAHRHDVPMVVLQTDYSKAFPSISKKHIEKVLHLHGFPLPFITMIKKLTKISPMKVQINGFLSETMYAERGTGQGDPLSSHLYDLAANPLNVMLAESPEVPRPTIPTQQNAQITLEAYADDNAIPLKANENGILRTIQLIESFRNVSGLELSNKKCILLFSRACSEEFCERLVQQTGMKKVQWIKYLGLKITQSGEIEQQTNLGPVHDKIKNMGQAITWRHASPLGKAIQVKSLLCSQYTHILQNISPSDEWLKKLWDTTRNIVWTRKVGDTSTMRIQISKTRINQPIKFGGLNLTHPSTITKSLRFIWIRRAMDKTSHNTNWRILLDQLLTEIRRPSIATHLKLGPREWSKTSHFLHNIHNYWAQTFEAIGETLQVCHSTQPQGWHQSSIIGHIYSSDEETQTSLSYGNLFAREMIHNGLTNVGQLFHTNHLETIIPNRLKLRNELEDEFNIALTPWQYLSIVTLVRDIKQKQRQALRTPVTLSKMTTLPSLYIAHRRGCRFITTMFSTNDRRQWEWGNSAKSYMTHVQDGLMTVSQAEFTRGFAAIQHAIATPRDKWLSTQIMNRTVWTNYKAYLAEQRRQAVRGNNDDINHMAICENCGQADEHTEHIFVTCPIAGIVWKELEDSLNYALRYVILDPDDSQRDHLPMKFSKSNIIYMKPTFSRNVQDTVNDILILGKRLIYSSRLTMSHPDTIPIRHALKGSLDILTSIRSSLALNFSIVHACANYFTN